NYRLQVFDPEGKYIGQIGQQGADIGQFEEPMDAATDRNDQVYVLDTWNHRIQVFDANGVHQNVIQGEFYGPRGIAIDRQTDIIYVTDTGHHVVKVFSPKGDLIRKIGNPADQAGNADGEFNEPIGMDVNSDGEVFVVDTRNARVQVFNRIWQHKASWPVQLTTEPNRGVESHIVCASDGTVFLTDPIGGRVLSFDREGNPLGEWREDADGEPLRTPLGIAVRESKAAPTPGKILLVTDLYDHKVRRIRVP
nr:NHL repeat-containing protein [bacterium]